MGSFRAALGAGLDGIETDLQRTRDGVLVLHHDPFLPDGRFIARLTFDELLAAAPAVARLDELFDLLADHEAAVLNLEVKTAAPFDDERVAELGAAIGGLPSAMRERVWVSSFDPLLLLRLADGGIEVPLAFIAFFSAALALTPHLPVQAVHPHRHLITAARIDDWHRHGLRVFAWTVNDLATAEGLLDLGVDGLVGDDPQPLLDARGPALTALRDR